jgi:outer membrane protein insertion porin family
MMIARTMALIVIGANMVLASFSEHAVVKEISFKGNNIFTSRQIFDVIETKIGSVLEPSVLSSDLQSILSLYRERGYYFAEVVVDTSKYPADSNAVAVLILINEGSQIKISQIQVTGNSALSQREILSVFQTRIGDYIIPSLLEEDINNLIGRYGRIGFPFTSVDVKDISLIDAKSSLSITIEVNEGKKVTIDEIQVEGNTTTDAIVIIRESRIKLHEIYDSKKIDGISDRLRRLNIFSQVDEPGVYSTSYGGGVTIRVAEGKTATFSGIAGYAPSRGGNGTFTGIIDIGMRNLFGTGRKFQVHWSKDERKSQDIRLNYVEPWIFNYPFCISVGFDQRQQDTTYVRRGIKGQTDLLVDESLTLSGVIGQQSVIPSDNTMKLMKSSSVIAGLEVGYDTRDQIICPLQGIWYSTQYHMERKKMKGDLTTLQRVNIDLEVFLQLFTWQVLHAGFHGKTLRGAGIEIGDLYRFGGTNTFRGYRENQFIGKDVAWTNFEYRLILKSRSFVYGFFDTGYFLLPAYETAGIAPARDYLIGYGVGIRFETAVGNIGLSFGFGKGDSFYNGKVHVGIVNEF